MATPKQIKRRGRLSLILGAIVATVLFAAIAYADNVVNNLDTTVDPASETMNLTVGGSDGSVRYWLAATGGDAKTGCNLTGSGSQLVVSLSSSNTSVATLGSGSATIAACGDATTGPFSSAISVHAVGAGSATITATFTSVTTSSAATSSGDYNMGTATFTVNVTAPNTAPSVPGTPVLAGGSSTPNQGVFGLTWTASTDDGNPNPPGALSYRLQHKDADDAGYSDVSGATALSTNSFAFTAGSPEDEGTWNYRVKASDGSLESAFSSDSASIVVDTSAPNAPTASATTSPAYTDGSGNNWWKDTVTVGFSANGDPNLQDGSSGSGVDASTIPANQTFTSLGVNTASGTVKDNAGNESAAGTLDVYVDNSTPTASFSDCPTAPLLLGSAAPTVHWSASDTGSGLSTASSGTATLDTSSVGAKSVESPAPADHVGHVGDKAVCNYSVIYNFHGFFAPVDNSGVYNVAKAGSAIPIKFDLGGDQGLSIFASGYPTSGSITCASSAELDPIEQTVTAGSSSLSYDATVNPPFGQYVYVWKTDKGWAGTCRQLVVKLVDGTYHRANFKFSR